MIPIYSNLESKTSVLRSIPKHGGFCLIGQDFVRPHSSALKQQSECTGTAVDGDNRRSLVKIYFTEFHSAFDI